MDGSSTPIWSRRGVAVVSLAFAASGCVGSPPVPNPFASTGLFEQPLDEHWSPESIERAEILNRGATDLSAMAVIRRMRPGWLRSRGRNSFSDSGAMYPVVYIDEIRHGGLGTLNQIPASEILRIEYYSTGDATTRWGTGHPSGVINVVTGR